MYIWLIKKVYFTIVYVTISISLLTLVDVNIIEPAKHIVVNRSNVKICDSLVFV